ncbi:hypothetical protein NKW54_15175 [Acetobacter cerevisiae]|uniref:Uncharacterized protein n=1 Tax=Acetobacter cerevisiae TaxID=178900 RepID=A0ABT1EV67_9PROT|nr:hypothetical protein [Acetobacter cerevisiae]MCP1247256.1 hypothetical protein [Acetobacter cerevisiae]MCP1256800.1 hypothetical protein [Acetobacter cerevisiae]
MLWFINSAYPFYIIFALPIILYFFGPNISSGIKKNLNFFAGFLAVNSAIFWLGSARIVVKHDANQAASSGLTASSAPVSGETPASGNNGPSKVKYDPITFADRENLWAAYCAYGAALLFLPTFMIDILGVRQRKPKLRKSVQRISSEILRLPPEERTDAILDLDCSSEDLKKIIHLVEKLNPDPISPSP